jgi:undecaprenyl-diphosphatase
VVSGVHQRVSPSDQFSFPSGHTAAAFVIATLISHFFPALLVPVYFWAFLMGVSRIYLGVHYPTDILAGLVIGIISAFAGIMVFG